MQVLGSKPCWKTGFKDPGLGDPKGAHIIKVESIGRDEEVLNVRQVQGESQNRVSVTAVLRLHRSAACLHADSNSNL